MTKCVSPPPQAQIFTLYNAKNTLVQSDTCRGVPHPTLPQRSETSPQLVIHLQHVETILATTSNILKFPVLQKPFDLSI